MKQRIKNIFKAYILLNIHVALSVVSLYFIFNGFKSNNYLFFLFFSTVLSYNLIRFISFGGNRFFVKAFFVKYKKTISLFLVLVTVLNIFFYLKLDLIQQVSLIPLFLITFLYNFEIKVIPKLRQFGLIKILLVAFVWAGVTVMVPQLHLLNNHTIWQSLYVFLLVSLLTLGFDQRDILLDETHLKTIPQRFHNHLRLIYTVYFITLSLLNMIIFNSLKLFITEIIIILSVILSYRSTSHKSFYYTAFWVEAIPIFWLILFIFLHQL